MNTDFLNLKLTEKLVQSRFSRTDFDENWKIIDEKMKELSETANVSFEPTDEELKKLAAMIVLSSGELEDIAENIILSATELEKIASCFSEEQMDFLLSKFSLTQEQLQEIASSLTESQLASLASYFTLSEEQVEQIIEGFELSDEELAKIPTYLTNSQLNTIASRLELTTVQLESMVALFTEEQLRDLASYFTLTEEQVEQIVEGFEISDRELEKISTYFTESQLNTIASHLDLTSVQLEALATLFTEEQLRLIASFFTLTDGQIQEIVETISFSDEDFKHLISLFSTEELTVLANLIEFSEEQLELLKGEPGKDAELVPFSTEQQRLIDVCTTGLNTKQEKLSDLEARATTITDDDLFALVQGNEGSVLGSGSQTKLIDAVLMAEYIVSKSPIPQVGLTLDDYTKQELWAIFNFGQGQNYFEVGDRMMWVSDRIVTTAQIADFNKDVKDLATGQRANVTFILNDYVQATPEEIASPWMSSKSEWMSGDIDCFASSIELQENGSITADLLPDDMVGLITPVFKNNGCSGAFQLYSETSKAYMWVLGAIEVYRGMAGVPDIFTGEIENYQYAIFNNATDNVTYLHNKTPTNVFLRWADSSSTGGWAYLTTTGAVTAITGTTNTSAICRQLPVGFCMG